MHKDIEQFILRATRATEIIESEQIQSLWSGYGSIDRIYLNGSQYSSIILKHVKFPNEKNHPKGWNSSLGHERKVKSYQVETNWYKNYAASNDLECRIPSCLASGTINNDVVLLLEDLDSASYDLRKPSLFFDQLKPCLSWLAAFHACHLGSSKQGLWSTGTYWHLATRPEELEALKDTKLKSVADKIDAKLKKAKYQTLVHGDAKLANFCFSEEGDVAAVDFQYVGGGCGMKDLAYFIGSCLSENDCEKHEIEILYYYFDQLKHYIEHYEQTVDFEALQAEWRSLYPYAWTDFHRFLKGWSPGHWKINSYSEKIAKQVIEELS